MLTIPEGDYSPEADLPDGVAYERGQLEEGGETGYRHYQLLVVLSRKQSLSGVKSIYGSTVHAELTRSSAANDYVWKEDTRIGEPFEKGTLPTQRNRKKDWDAIWLAATEGDLSQVPADVRVQHYRTLRTIRADFAVPEAMVRQCFVYCGRTGTGKSRRAWDEAGLSAYPKDPRTKFWDGYRDQEHVVIDEFRGDIHISHILRWLDRYPCIVEIKGASVVLRAKKIWITSNLHPDYWFPEADQETKDAVMRRLEITVFE